MCYRRAGLQHGLLTHKVSHPSDPISRFLLSAVSLMRSASGTGWTQFINDSLHTYEELFSPDHPWFYQTQLPSKQFCRVTNGKERDGLGDSGSRNNLTFTFLVEVDQPGNRRQTTACLWVCCSCSCRWWVSPTVGSCTVQKDAWLCTLYGWY